MSRELNAPGALAAAGYIPLAEPNLGDGETAAVVVAKTIIAALYGAADVPTGNPAAPPAAS